MISCSPILTIVANDMNKKRHIVPVPNPNAYYSALRGYERRRPVYIGLMVLCIALAIIATGLPVWFHNSDWMFGMRVLEIRAHLTDVFDAYHAKSFVVAISLFPMVMVLASVIGIYVNMSHDRYQVEEILKIPLRTLAYYMVNDCDNTSYDLNAYYDAFGTEKTINALSELFKEYAPVE